MILPIVAYGDPVLRKVCRELTSEYPNLQQLIADMQQTMQQAQGVGLAAPQIGKAIRLFVMDASGFAENETLTDTQKNELRNFKKVCINPKILQESGEVWNFKEGCLSIPQVSENVSRHSTVAVRYLDENFVPQKEVFTGLVARIFQHEYDHIEGKLFIDKLSGLKRQLLKKKLNNIRKGNIKTNYPMRFYK